MDIILTGIARSGTTLSCSLLNKLPQCVALHEPMNPAELIGQDLAMENNMTAKELLAAYAAGERDFSKANLSGADLVDADLRGAKLDGANRDGVIR